MQMFYVTFCLLAISTAFASPTHQSKASDTLPLFERYLAKCRQNQLVNQPVYLCNAYQDTEASSHDVYILNLETPTMMQSDDIADRILYGDADIVHLSNTSTHTAARLHELLQQHYAHFIYVPCEDSGAFIASKYPLKHAEVTRILNGNTYNDLLNFTILEEDISARVYRNNFSIRTTRSNDTDDFITAPIRLFDIPATISVLKKRRQQLSPRQLPYKKDMFTTEAFEILPIRKGGDNDNRGGSYGGGRIDVEFGPRGPEWSASVFGGYEDDRGNYVEVEVRRNEEGTTSTSAEAGHEKDK